VLAILRFPSSDRLKLPRTGVNPALGGARIRQAGIDGPVAHRGPIIKKRATEHNDARAPACDQAAVALRHQVPLRFHG
jgi:hypothetical protein